MELYQSMARKYKKGKSYQWSVPLKKGHPFEDKEEVTIVKLDELKKVEAEVEELRNINEKMVIDSAEAMKQLMIAKEVINQYKEVMKTQETILAIYTNRGMWGRLRNNKPEEAQQLAEEKVKLKKLEDNTPMVIELARTTSEDED